MLPPRSAIRSFAAAVLLAVELVAQGVRAEVGLDPYSKGDAAAIQRAGYVRFAPFPFGAGHGTADVEELLGTEPLAWIETEHFRVGCALPAVELASEEDWGKQWIRGVRKELAELHEKLPAVRTRAKVLDPWLRAHLFAHRLEKLYAEVAADLGLSGGLGAGVPTWHAGSGPYLGMQEKFTVLLLQKRASHARYTKKWHGVEIEDPIRLHDRELDCMYWGASEETADGLLADDLAMHAHLVFNVAHNLYSGFRGYRRELPPWFVTGLGHVHARHVTKRFPVHDRRDDHDRGARSVFWQWDERVPGLVRKEAFDPLAKLVVQPNAGEFGLEQHMQAWSVVDYLVTCRREQTFRFLALAKQSGVARDDAFVEAFGCGPDEVDAAWRGWAQRTRRH